MRTNEKSPPASQARRDPESKIGIGNVNRSQRLQYALEHSQQLEGLCEAFPNDQKMIEQFGATDFLVGIAQTPDGQPKRFFSSGVDTVKVRFALAHRDLGRYKRTQKSTRHGGFLVKGKWDSVATVFGSKDGQTMTVELSIPKFLTGQNIVSTHDVAEATVEAVERVISTMELKPTMDERKSIRKRELTLLRVDFAAHCDCITKPRALALAVALRAYLSGRSKEMSTYGFIQTLYDSQHSRHRSVRMYLKGEELKAKGHEMSLDIDGREFLVGRADALVRFELTLRSQGLRTKGLNKLANWTSDIGQELLQGYVDNLTPLHSSAVDLAGMGKLTGVTLLRFQLWLRGDLNAFEQSSDARRKQKKEILNATGIDIDNPLSIHRQAEIVQSAQAILNYGFGFQSRKEWAKLKQDGR